MTLKVLLEMNNLKSTMSIESQSDQNSPNTTNSQGWMHGNDKGLKDRIQTSIFSQSAGKPITSHTYAISHLKNPTMFLKSTYT